MKNAIPMASLVCAVIAVVVAGIALYRPPSTAATVDDYHECVRGCKDIFGDVESASREACVTGCRELLKPTTGTAKEPELEGR